MSEKCKLQVLQVHNSLFFYAYVKEISVSCQIAGTDHVNGRGKAGTNKLRILLMSVNLAKRGQGQPEMNKNIKKSRHGLYFSLLTLATCHYLSLSYSTSGHPPHKTYRLYKTEYRGVNIFIKQCKRLYEAG